MSSVPLVAWAGVPPRAGRELPGAGRRVARGRTDAPASAYDHGPAAPLRAAHAQQRAERRRHLPRPRSRTTARRSRFSRTATCTAAGLHRFVAGRCRNGQAHPARGPQRAGPDFEAACSIAERLLARRAVSRAHGAGPGRDVPHLWDIQAGKEIRRFPLALESVTGPTWSPDGRRLVFSGNDGGITDLYIVNADGTASATSPTTSTATSSRNGRRTARRSPS